MRSMALLLLTTIACEGGGEPTDEVLPCDGEWPVYDEEMVVTRGSYSGAIVTDEPPMVGVNSWIFDVRNASGAPLNGASVTLTPVEIDTGDRLTPEDYSSTLGDGPGRYAIEAFDLPNAGGWRFRFLVASGMENQVLPIELCIE